MNTSTEEQYQGWTNYETWAVALWLGNDESTYNYWQDQVRLHIENAPQASQVKEGIWTVEQAACFTLADTLRDTVEQESPLADAGSLYSDLLGAAFDSVNWLEIATNWFDDVVTI